MTVMLPLVLRDGVEVPMFKFFRRIPDYETRLMLVVNLSLKDLAPRDNTR